MPTNPNIHRLYTRRDLASPTSFVEILTEAELRERVDKQTADWLVNGSIVGHEERADHTRRGAYGVVKSIKQDALLELFDLYGAPCGTVRFSTMIAQRAQRGMSYHEIKGVEQLLADGHVVRLGAVAYRVAN